jgi:purine-binding chemotaxis protein CheW
MEKEQPDEGTRPESAGTIEKYLIFTIRGRRYTIPSKLISEVAVVEKIFPLPLVPDYVRGIINRYSAPYALLDVGLLLLKAPSEAAKVVVLKETVDKLAFLIDDVIDIADVGPEHLLKVEKEAENEVSGLVESSFDWQGEPVFCLNVKELIQFIKALDNGSGER